MNKGTKKIYDLEWSDEFMQNSFECSRNHSKARRYEKRQNAKAVRRWNKKMLNEELLLNDTHQHNNYLIFEDGEIIRDCTNNLLVFNNGTTGYSYENVAHIQKPFACMPQSYVAKETVSNGSLRVDTIIGSMVAGIVLCFILM